MKQRPSRDPKHKRIQHHHHHHQRRTAEPPTRCHSNAPLAGETQIPPADMRVSTAWLLPVTFEWRCRSRFILSIFGRRLPLTAPTHPMFWPPCQRCGCRLVALRRIIEALQIVDLITDENQRSHCTVVQKLWHIWLCPTRPNNQKVFHYLFYYSCEIFFFYRLFFFCLFQCSGAKV